MSDRLRFAFFGSSLLSAYWNGACTYYRGLIRALDARGHTVTFYEPRAFSRQEHRDLDDPPYARVVVYEPTGPDAVRAVVRGAPAADVVVKTSGVGVYDDVLEAAVLERAGDSLRIFWDVDAPATLGRMEADADDGLRALIPEYDLILTYGGGQPVVDRYGSLGARRCEPIYNALDPDTHHPVPVDPRYAVDLALLANRLPDRERRVQEFFFGAAALRPELSFLLGGNGWSEPPPGNVDRLGHVPTVAHNAINSSARAILNVTRDGMAVNGFSPATRVFEAAGAAACVITDAWAGVECFFAPGTEILVADDGAGVATILDQLHPDRAREIGAAARARTLAEHTYAQRAQRVESVLATALAGV